MLFLTITTLSTCLRAYVVIGAATVYNTWCCSPTWRFSLSRLLCSRKKCKRNVMSTLYKQSYAHFNILQAIIHERSHSLHQINGNTATSCSNLQPYLSFPAKFKKDGGIRVAKSKQTFQTRKIAKFRQNSLE